MKIKKMSYPHPVLTEFNDDYKNSSFSADLTGKISKNSDNVEFYVTFDLNNARLEELIESNAARFVAHVECDSSMYREAFTSNSSQLSFVIPQKKLTKQADVSFMIVANTAITDYNNELLHEDYDGVKLVFNKGAYLAVHPGVSLIFEKDPIISAKSIFTLRASEEETPLPFDMDYNNGVINIYLPKKVYDEVERLQSYEQLNPLLIAMYYMPALIDTLNYMYQLEDPQNDDEAKDSEWYNSILHQLEQLNIDPKNIDEIGASVIAHKILENVMDEALQSVSDIFAN